MAITLVSDKRTVFGNKRVFMGRITTTANPETPAPSQFGMTQIDQVISDTLAWNSTNGQLAGVAGTYEVTIIGN